MTFVRASTRQSVPKIKQYHPNGRKSCARNQRVKKATDAYAVTAANSAPTADCSRATLEPVANSRGSSRTEAAKMTGVASKNE